MWPVDILQTLHALPHLSISLGPVSHDFSLSREYAESQMLLICMTLALGFSLLLVLAALLCAVISFTRPVDTPTVPARLTVMGVAVAVAAAAAAADAFNKDFSAGLDKLIASLDDLRTMAAELGISGSEVAAWSLRVDAAIGLLAECSGCPRLQADLRHNESLCDALAVRSQVARSCELFATDTRRGAAHFGHAIDTLRYSTGWHAWGTSLPLFALLATACAVNVGACVGRRWLLVGSQFFAVIVMWMLCAITAVQLAIAVGLADACIDPLGTVQRVLAWFVSRTQRAESDMFTLRLATHYLQNCSLPNPLAYRLHNASAGLRTLGASLGRLSLNCSTPALLGPATSALKSTEALVHGTLAALDGQRACDRVLRGFRQGVEEGLCGELTQGVVGVLVWQSACGVLLLLLAALLPALWHSHWLPPLECACNAELWRRRLRRAMERSDAVAERLLPTEAAEEGPSLAPLGALPFASAGAAGSLATGSAVLELGGARDGARASGSRSSGAGPSSAGAIPATWTRPRGIGGGRGSAGAGTGGVPADGGELRVSFSEASLSDEEDRGAASRDLSPAAAQPRPDSAQVLVPPVPAARPSLQSGAAA